MKFQTYTFNTRAVAAGYDIVFTRNSGTYDVLEQIDLSNVNRDQTAPAQFEFRVLLRDH